MRGHLLIHEIGFGSKLEGQLVRRDHIDGALLSRNLLFRFHLILGYDYIELRRRALKAVCIGQRLSRHVCVFVV